MNPSPSRPDSGSPPRHNVFTRDELMRAHKLVIPEPAKLKRCVDDWLRSDEWGTLTDVSLNLLSLVSPETAEKVQKIRGETDEEASERIKTFLREYPSLALDDSR